MKKSHFSYEPNFILNFKLLILSLSSLLTTAVKQKVMEISYFYI